jgi:hypothetical protein
MNAMIVHCLAMPPLTEDNMATITAVSSAFWVRLTHTETHDTSSNSDVHLPFDSVYKIELRGRSRSANELILIANSH